MEGPATGVLRFSHVDADQKKFKGFLDVPLEGWWSSTGTTVGDLERKIATQTGLRVVLYIAYRGVQLEKNRQMSTLILDDADYRFSVHTTSGENIFFVKSLGGNSVTVNLPLNTSTVKELKDKIEALEKIPAKYQRFLYNGKHLADTEPVTKTLSDYGVERDSTVQLLTRLRGGAPGQAIEFSDLQNQSALRVLPWSKAAPAWRIVGKGLNLEGKCTNEACLANGKNVVCQKGFTVVNLTTEKASCPVCKQTVTVKTCSFTSCSWMFEGRKAAKPRKLRSFLTACFGRITADEYPAMKKQSNSRDIVSPWFKASNQYEYFLQRGNMVPWEKLLVVAKKIPTVSTNDPHAQIPIDESCSICFHKFEASGDHAKTHTTTCGHTFHADCVRSWVACSGTACPICRAELVVEH